MKKNILTLTLDISTTKGVLTGEAVYTGTVTVLLNDKPKMVNRIHRGSEDEVISACNQYHIAISKSVEQLCDYVKEKGT